MSTHHITGTFTVKMNPQPWAEAPVPDVSPGVSPDAAPGIAVGRLLLDKQYQGDLQAQAQGQMLSAVSGVQGSAGYVAVEVVTGTLLGRAGSFALLHRGVMTRGTPELSVTVVPDTGTEALQGLKGSLHIRIEGGQHFYDFEFSLP